MTKLLWVALVGELDGEVAEIFPANFHLNVVADFGLVGCAVDDGDMDRISEHDRVVLVTPIRKVPTFMVRGVDEEVSHDTYYLAGAENSNLP